MDDASHSAPDWLALDRFFAGDCSPEERAGILDWVSRYPSRRLFLRDVQALGEPLAVVASAADIARAWEDVSPHIGDKTQELPSDTNHVLKESGGGRYPIFGRVFRSQALRGDGFKAQPLRRGVWYVAVSLVIGIMGILVGWNERGQLFTSHMRRRVSTYATTNGEQATITLVDGTTVALNVASRLDVPADYATGNHTVRLTGEAMFTVAHHDRTSFTVLAGSTATKVLGTTFLVRQYPTDSNVTVAVRQGRVAVGSTVLTTAQVAQVGRSGLAHVSVVNPSQFSFATGFLTLDSMTLSAAIPELNRWYNTDIQLGDPTLATKQIKGEFTVGSLSDLSELLEWTFELHVVRTGRVLTLFPKTK